MDIHLHTHSHTLLLYTYYTLYYITPLMANPETQEIETIMLMALNYFGNSKILVTPQHNTSQY